RHLRATLISTERRPTPSASGTSSPRERARRRSRPGSSYPFNSNSNASRETTMLRPAILSLLLLGGSAVAEGQELPRTEQQTAPSPGGTEEQTPGTSPPPPPVLETVKVSASAPPDASSQYVIPGRDFELLPQGLPDAILRSVPGLAIGHPAGGGKAENYLL